MVQFFRFAVLYFFVALSVASLATGGSFMQLRGAFSLVESFALANSPVLAVGAFAAVWVGRSSEQPKKILSDMLLAVVGTAIFFTAFALMKTSLPYILPFYADPALAEIDRVLHGGVAPWALTVHLPVDADWAYFFYIQVWSVLALGFPTLLVFTDPDLARRSRYLWMWAGVWIGLGNIIALGGMSVGPVYYDIFYDSERFSDLTLALEHNGVSSSMTGKAHRLLLYFYAMEGQAIGSGISAFPSVHVGMSALLGFYVADRFKGLWWLGAAFCMTILFLSVYLGWHYAIDGYISIILVTIMVQVLRRRAAKPGLQPLQN